jgi:hypothetical protein
MCKTTLWRGGLGLSLALSATLGCWGTDHPPAAASSELKVSKVAAAPIDDPSAAAWDSAPESTVIMLPQSITYPILGRGSITELKARALVDDKFLALRLSWSDKTHNETLEVDKFTDAVAIELPLGNPEKTNPMMGSADYPVYILHWKAVWQHDVDKGRADVQDLHPGYYSDPYPFVAGRFPYEVQESFQTDNARRYFPGLAAGNPVSKLYRRWPVEELHAEGFGSLADHSAQDARGKGIWKDDRWSVVLSIPREVPDRANPHLLPGQSTLIAFAVWDGGMQNVGGRKHWAPFLKLVLP